MIDDLAQHAPEGLMNQGCGSSCVQRCYAATGDHETLALTLHLCRTWGRRMTLCKLSTTACKQLMPAKPKRCRI